MNINNIKLWQLLLLLGLVILIIPPLLILPSFSDLFNFEEKGQIGDTIGGITAPFINAIAAILVFVAFKEQVKANELIKEQQYLQIIQVEIHRLEDDFLKIDKVISDINTELELKNYIIKPILLNKIGYLISIFMQTIEMIEKLDSNREFLLKKISKLYVIVYSDKLLDLKTKFEEVDKNETKSGGTFKHLLFDYGELDCKMEEISQAWF